MYTIFIILNSLLIIALVIYVIKLRNSVNAFEFLMMKFIDNNQSFYVTQSNAIRKFESLIKQMEDIIKRIGDIRDIRQDIKSIIRETNLEYPQTNKPKLDHNMLLNMLERKKTSK